MNHLVPYFDSLDLKDLNVSLPWILKGDISLSLGPRINPHKQGEGSTIYVLEGR